jgi:hypothetical protein
MNNFFRTIIAGYGAKKLGGGCFSTIIIFIVIYYALGQCNSPGVRTSQKQVNPKNVSVAPKIDDSKTLALNLQSLKETKTFKL